MTYRKLKRWSDNPEVYKAITNREFLWLTDVILLIGRLPFFKRRKWWKKHKHFIVDGLVKPINERIKENKEEQKLKAEIDAASLCEDILGKYPVLKKYNFEYVEGLRDHGTGVIILEDMDAILDLMHEVGDVIFYLPDHADTDVKIRIYDNYVEW